ncbi:MULTISPECIES: GDSL-type esterase/lipase family protein [unclassified Modestobacter]
MESSSTPPSATASSTPPTTSAPATGAPATSSSGGPSAVSAPAGTSSPGFLPPGSEPETFAAVGDSITAGSIPLDGPTAGVGTWVTATATEPLELADGWAVPGATTADMLAAVDPMDADHLVLMGGTNDVIRGLDPDQAMANLVAVAAEAGIPDVVLAAIPPLDSHPDAAIDFNRRLAELAQQQGWQFVDPWEGIGDGGGYLPGTSADGIHPSAGVVDLVGTRIRAAVLYGEDR